MSHAKEFYSKYSDNRRKQGPAASTLNIMTLEDMCVTFFSDLEVFEDGTWVL